MRTVLLTFLCILYANVECKTWNGYIIDKSSGLGYKIMYQSQTWPVARDRCKDDGAQLAVPRTQEDFLFIQKLVRAMQYPSITDTDYKLLVWLGIHNLNDYRVWETVDGQNLEDVGFHKWAGDNGHGYSDAVEEPHCAGMDSTNPGLRDYWCHRRQPYVCQIDIRS